MMPLTDSARMVKNSRFCHERRFNQLRPALKDMTEVLKNIELINTELVESSKVEPMNLSWRGKTFAVISAIAVAETSSKIEVLITEGRSIVQGGVSVSQQCNQVLTEIIDKISRVSSMAEEISSASQDQADGVQEITKSVHDLNSITQKNMASGKE